jgi:hypothetical protein
MIEAKYVKHLAKHRIAFGRDKFLFVPYYAAKEILTSLTPRRNLWNLGLWRDDKPSGIISRR